MGMSLFSPPVNFALHHVSGSRSVLHHEGHCLVPGPVHGVQPRVHHQSAGPEQVKGEEAELCQLVLVKQPHFVSQKLGVETPALCADCRHPESARNL